jgi:hypothetical protein
MKRRSSFARFWVFATIAALAFSQAALAAFACPMAVPMTMEAMASADAPCLESGPASQHLCVKTCQDEPQKHDTPSLAALPPAVDTGLRVALASPPAHSGPRVLDAPLARATSPPPSILFVRFLK